MDDKFHYRLTKDTKNEIAQNLVDVLQKDATITKETRIFISNWLLTDHTGKRKAFGPASSLMQRVMRCWHTTY